MNFIEHPSSVPGFPQQIIRMALPPFTEPTTGYWQNILPPGKASPPPWQFGVPAHLPNSRILMLPIRPLNNESNDAVASLLVNQASISVVNELGKFLADRVRPYNADVIIGLPTLGLSLAPIVAQNLGLSKELFQIGQNSQSFCRCKC